jgi:hypothetical protein
LASICAACARVRARRDHAILRAAQLGRRDHLHGLGDLLRVLDRADAPPDIDQARHAVGRGLLGHEAVLELLDRAVICRGSASSSAFFLRISPIDRQRRILALLQNLHQALAAIELRLRRLVEIGAELREGRQFAVLRQVQAQRAGDLLHRLDLRVAADADTEMPTLMAGRMLELNRSVRGRSGRR